MHSNKRTSPTSSNLASGKSSLWSICSALIGAGELERGTVAGVDVGFSGALRRESFTSEKI